MRAFSATCLGQRPLNALCRAEQGVPHPFKTHVITPAETPKIMQNPMWNARCTALFWAFHIFLLQHSIYSTTYLRVFWAFHTFLLKHSIYSATYLRVFYIFRDIFLYVTPHYFSSTQAIESLIFPHITPYYSTLPHLFASILSILYSPSQAFYVFDYIFASILNIP